MNPWERKLYNIFSWPKFINKMQGKMSKKYFFIQKSAKIDLSEAKNERISYIYETQLNIHPALIT